MKTLKSLFAISCLISTIAAAQETSLVREGYDYVAPMRKVAAKFKGRDGVVIHVGDSITYANPYGQWARFGQGKAEADKAMLKWMHTNSNDSTDGWFLARIDRPGGRSDTAASGIRVDQMLKGGRRGMLSLAEMLKKYQPQMVVLMLGTNDASANRPLDAYLADMTNAVDLIFAHNAICILSTIPPHPHRFKLAEKYNEGLRRLAKKHAFPLIDFEWEILKRRPNDWNGTLLSKNDVHPTASRNNVKPSLRHRVDCKGLDSEPYCSHELV